MGVTEWSGKLYDEKEHQERLSLLKKARTGDSSASKKLVERYKLTAIWDPEKGEMIDLTRFEKNINQKDIPLIR